VLASHVYVDAAIRGLALGAAFRTRKTAQRATLSSDSVWHEVVATRAQKFFITSS
jgi:hypothetical protein